MKYDILLKGGTVIDAAQELNALRDVAIKNGVIAAIGQNIPDTELMHPGLSFEEVIQKATYNAAKAIRREDQLGNLTNNHGCCCLGTA